MTDQPETTEEFHRKKLQRVIAAVGALLVAAMCAMTGFVLEAVPGGKFGLLLMIAGVAFYFQAAAMLDVGPTRRVYNLIPGFGVDELHSPDDRHAEVPADD